MAITHITGFEFASEGADGVYTGGASPARGAGTWSYSTAQVRTGTYSVRCNPASGATGYTYAPTNTNVGWWHFALYIATLPSVRRNIWGNNSLGINLALESTGAITWRSNGTDGGTSSTTLTTGQWYWIGFRCQISGTNVDVLHIDGVSEVSGVTYSVASTGGPSIGPSNTEASAIDIYFDDLILDNAGFIDTAYKVAILRPTSDGTRGAWTAGAGGTTNLYAAVDNVPPTGVASASESNTTNVESASSSGTDALTLNCPAYTTVITTSDTIRAVQSRAAMGEDASTGTKNLQLTGTNPTQTGTARDVTWASSGAHGADPTAWYCLWSNAVVDPGAIHSNTPTVTLTKTDTTTRTACVEAVGVYVAYELYVATDPRYQSKVPRLARQAVNRVAVM